MKFSYNWLSDFVQTLPSPEKLAELITLQAYQVEKVARAGRDTVFDIDILPNRAADSAGHIGVAREIHAITGRKFVLPKAVFKTSREPIKKFISSEVSLKGSKRYMLAFLDGARVEQSPTYIRERLLACGLRPINAIVDATNYIMLETGHPAHAFDYDKIEGKKIFVRPAKAGEKMETIDGVVVSLSREDLVIADARGPIAIAGVKGGKRAEITSGTRRVLFEMGVFDPNFVRNTARRIGISTDASTRFSQGLPAETLEYAMKRLLTVVQETAGGEAASGFADIHGPFAKRSPILLDIAYVPRLLGKEIQAGEVARILVRVGCQVSKKTKNMLVVAAPPWRLDLAVPEDLIEEVGRIYGYQNIEASAPRATLRPAAHDVFHTFVDALRAHAKAAGFSEVINYAFASGADLAMGANGTSAVEVANPISREYAYLRTSLAPHLLRIVRANSAHDKNLRLFEIGNVFRLAKKGPEEALVIGGVLTTDKKTGELFYEAKGFLEMLLEEFGLDDVWFRDNGAHLSWPFSDPSIFHRHRFAVVMSGKTTLGVVGEIHPDIAPKAPVLIFELSAALLLGEVRRDREFEPISKFPAVVRDIAVVVPRDTRADEVVEIIENIGGKLLASSDLFDYYEDEAIGEDNKSLAFRLVFQSSERTLTDQEVAASMSAISKALQELGWEVRS